MWNFFNGLTIFMSLYGPYLGNPSMDFILLLQMERLYVGAVQEGFIFYFRKLNKWENIKKYVQTIELEI